MSGAPNTTGTYDFSPAMGEAVLYAYGLCGIRPTQLVQDHFFTARMATNLLTAEWSARGVNLWQVELFCQMLTPGVSTYSVPPNVITILDAYISQNYGGGLPIDRLIFPISRSEYAAYSSKQQQGGVTSFWFDRLLQPTITLWPVPPLGSQNQVLKYYMLRQTQDSNLQDGKAVEIPAYFQNAFSLALAWRLALTWAPAQVPILKPLADEAYQYAATQNVETAAFMVSPQISGYYR